MDFGFACERAATAAFAVAAPILSSATAEAAGALLIEFFALCTYSFYLFSGVSLLFGAHRLQIGDIGGFVKCMAGAALLFLAPTFASEISSLFDL